MFSLIRYLFVISTIIIIIIIIINEIHRDASLTKTSGPLSELLR